MKRFVLFVLVNLVVTLTLVAIATLVGVRPYLTQYGIDYTHLAYFCLIWGMGGATISLMLSRKFAVWGMGVKVIDPKRATAPERDLLHLVHGIAKRAGMRHMPQVGIFPSNQVNAFATGPSQKRSLVAVSQGLLTEMESGEIEAIIGHEITHITNGDMITMTLLQGIINAFAMFAARILAVALGGGRGKNSSRRPNYMLVYLFEIVFMILGSIITCWFSRKREYKADAGGAHLSSTSKMIDALRHLDRIHNPDKSDIPESMAALMAKPIRKNGLSLFRTHPPLADRIKMLEQRAHGALRAAD
ncbi:MAG: protease HtpX [Simkaniaceae bacterium]|nr:protease HtpX [Simkaniaceae bacterium]